MKKEPTVYKFTFYGCAHPWGKPKGDADLKDQVEESLCYVDALQQMTKLEVTELSLKEKPKPRRKAVKKGAS